MRYYFERLYEALCRRKKFNKSNLQETSLSRCLTKYDLTALGVGSTLGLGIYILGGQVAHDSAGPSVILSFLIAGIASIFAGMCYAEFGAKIPKTGSAYVYTYVTMGEFLAFIIGWNLILEYSIGTASVARAWSEYVDRFTGGHMEKFFLKYMRMNIANLADYPDLFAFAITLLLTVLLGIGVKESSMFNNVCTILNLIVVIYAFVCGMFKANLSNWQLSGNPNVETIGKGGFFPFGIGGTLAGAATCFYGFVGFDAIATTGEEVKNPGKSIPFAIIISLICCCVAYSATAIVTTLLCPYYLIDGTSSLPFVFQYVGWTVAEHIISVGAIIGLSTSLLGAMFPLPRIIYAMASDGVLFLFLSKVHHRFKTPFIATLISGTLVGLIAAIFSLKELVAMMSIGTLLAYSLVALCVLILRYEDQSIILNNHSLIPPSTTMTTDTGTTTTQSINDEGTFVQSKVPEEIFSEKNNSFYENSLTNNYTNDFDNQYNPDNDDTSRNDGIKSVTFKSKILVTINTITAALLAVLASYAAPKLTSDYYDDNTPFFIIIIISIVIVLLLYIISIIQLMRLPQMKQTEKKFQMPLVPFLPSLSMFINFYLMCQLSTITWIRFGVWLLLGLIIYFTYGIRHSKESSHRGEDTMPILHE
ncbi:hypothetical protein SNEBB_008931 [Seison nebaliae]|nr:hypothetical protein SNEBB_008931 [Seison nebaliae]